jgi:hypothetical protein
MQDVPAVTRVQAEPCRFVTSVVEGGGD